MNSDFFNHLRKNGLPLMPHCYMLDEAKRPVAISDTVDFLQWEQKGEWNLARTEFEGGYLSTVFLRYGPTHGCFFETAIWGDDALQLTLVDPDGDIYQEAIWHYHTWEEAMAGHEKIAGMLILAGLKPLE